MVKASAADAHEQQVARCQLLVLLQLTEAGFFPAAVKIGLRLELLRTGAALPVTQCDAVLGIPVAGQRPAVMHAKHPFAADQWCLEAAGCAVAP